MKQWTPPVVLGISVKDDDAALFARLNIPCVLANEVTEHSWTLTRDPEAGGRLVLRRADNVSLSVDFTAGKARHRTGESGHGAQSLIKAIGMSRFTKKHGRAPCVIDATGGLCQDAWALASAGCQILVIEQHPIVHALVEDALQRASSGTMDPREVDSAAMAHTGDRKISTCSAYRNIDSICARITLVHADATEYLAAHDCDEPQVIYLDPMYPARRKRASSKKGMQFLQSLLGPAAQSNDAQLLNAALDSRVPRVVVKRPKGADRLAGSDTFSGQSEVIESANTRYDVYISHESSDTA